MHWLFSLEGRCWQRLWLLEGRCWQRPWRWRGVAGNARGRWRRRCLATSVGVAGNAPPNAITQPALNRQIERVLENPEFNWRQSYSPAQGSKQKPLIDQLISWIRETSFSFGNALNRLWKSLLKVFDFKNFFAEPPTSESQLPSGVFEALTYLLWAAFAGILILFAIRLRKLRATVRPKPVVPPPTPDLTDEQISARSTSR